VPVASMNEFIRGGLRNAPGAGLDRPAPGDV